MEIIMNAKRGILKKDAKSINGKQIAWGTQVVILENDLSFFPSDNHEEIENRRTAEKKNGKFLAYALNEQVFLSVSPNDIQYNGVFTFS